MVESTSEEVVKGCFSGKRMAVDEETCATDFFSETVCRVLVGACEAGSDGGERLG